MEKKTRTLIFAYASCASLIFGLLGGLFLSVADWLMAFMWKLLPASLGLSNWIWWPLVICSLLGLVIGFLQEKIGPYPRTIQEVLGEVRKSGGFASQGWWKTCLNGLTVLAAGGSVGPEASLTGIIAGQCTWLGQHLKALLLDETKHRASLGEQVRILFWQRASSAKPLASYFKSRARQRASYTIWTLLGILGFVLWRKLVPQERVFGIHNRPVAWNWHVLLLLLPAFGVGLAFGWLFVKLGKWSSYALTDRGSKIWQGAAGGLLLGVAAMASPYFMFSGAFTIAKLAKSAAIMGPLLLLALGLGKAALTNVGFFLGWRGGTIFPAIFCSLAVGGAFALLFPWTQNLVAAVITSTAVTVIVGRPLLVALLLVFLFSIRLAPAIVFFCLLARWVLRKFPQVKP
ncbi:chloride channel protein [Lactobacillus porci]|uniref:chloride channel protein n=1 Tax=Lactobacillus porci TaxID=2012477 RepID=UPI003991F5D5